MTRNMFNFNFIAFLISMAVLIRARDSPSALPITYICPPQDEGAFPLAVNDVTTDPIFCSYPNSPADDPNDFFCSYALTTGVLVLDSDADLCAGNAVQVIVMSIDRHQSKAHAPLPTRPRNVGRAISDEVADKTHLKKSMRHAASPNIVI